MAGTIKGISVEIGGNVTPLQKALAGVNESTKSLQSELKQCDNLLKLDPNNVDILRQKQELLAKSVENTSEKLNTLKNTQVQVQKQFESGDIGEEQYRAFQREVAKAETELTKLKNSAETNNTMLSKTSGEFSDAGKEAEKFSDEVKKSADTTDDSSSKFDKLGSVMGTVGKAFAAGIAAIGTGAATATAELVGASQAGAEYADNILTLSTQTGMSTDALQEYSYAADLVDVSLNTLTGSMAKNVKSMSNAAQGSEKYAEAYKRLGVEVTNADGTLRNSEEVYWSVIDALGQVSNETERDALAMQLFGKSAQDLNPLIAQGSDGMKGLAAEAQAAGAVLSGDSLSAFGTFDDSIQKLTQGSQAAQNALGTILLPQLTELSDTGVSLLADFTSGLNEANGDMEKIGDVVSGVLSEAINSIVEMLPEFVDYGLQIVTSITGAIGENLPQLVEAATDIILSLTDKLIELLPDIIDTGIDIIMSLIDGITEALPELIPAAVEAVTTIVQGLVDRLPDILDAALQIVMALTQGILDALPQLIEALPEIITGIVDFIIGAIPQIIETGVKLLVSLVEALPEIITAIVESIPQIIDGIIDAVLDNIPLIIEAGIKLFVALIENLPQIIVEIVKAIPQIISGIVSAFTDNFGKIKDVGKNMITGLWEGISDAGAWLASKISGFFGGIVDNIKDFFGIHSPSTLFENEIGVNLALGIGSGFDKTMSKVTKSMRDALPTGDLVSNIRFDMNDVSAASSGIKAASASVSNSYRNDSYNYKFDSLIKLTVQGNIDNNALPPLKDILKKAADYTITKMNDPCRRKGTYISANKITI